MNAGCRGGGREAGDRQAVLLRAVGGKGDAHAEGCEVPFWRTCSRTQASPMQSSPMHVAGASSKDATRRRTLQDAAGCLLSMWSFATRICPHLHDLLLQRLCLSGQRRQRQLGLGGLVRQLVDLVLERADLERHT